MSLDRRRQVATVRKSKDSSILPPLPPTLNLTPRFAAASSGVLLRRAASDLFYTTRLFWAARAGNRVRPPYRARPFRVASARHPSAGLAETWERSQGLPPRFRRGHTVRFRKTCAVLRLELRVCRWSILSRDSNWPRRDRMQLMGLLDCRFHFNPDVRVTTDMDGNRLHRECRLRQWPLPVAGRSVSNEHSGTSHERPRATAASAWSFSPPRNAGNDTRLGLIGRICLVPFYWQRNAARERREPGSELLQDGGARNEVLSVRRVRNTVSSDGIYYSYTVSTS
jgi:hypothetical protein